jgi:O-antigen/teichoic acid export membrane protein
MFNFARKFFLQLAAIKQLAGQTLWYGLSNVGVKMLNFLLTPLLTNLLADKQGMVDYGNMSIIFAWIAAANIIFTYGLETAYFRFCNKNEYTHENIFHTAFGSILISTLGLSILLLLVKNPIQVFLELGNHTEYIVWCISILALDSLSAIPFARLRQENKPRKYAFIKLASIIINISSVVLFIVVLPKWVSNHPDSAFSHWYQSKSRLGFVLLANLFQSLFTFLMLFKEWRVFRFKIDKKLWVQMFIYSSPMIIIGLAGMINEVMDRQFLDKLLPFSPAENKRIVGIYGANYKLAIFITLFIQAFKMAAEPFFFSQAKEKNAPVLYARVMKWFVITLAIAFLFSALYIDVWQVTIIRGKSYRTGVGVVPVLLLANIFLGIYYNLSVWYKLTDRMRMGIYITIIGAIITFIGNYYFIPKWGMYASAWATFVCYFVMMILAYFMGQKYYPIPYPIKKILSYLTVMLIFFFVKTGVNYATEGLNYPLQLTLRVVTATGLMLLYLLLVMKVERAELKTMPFIGKYIR